MSALGWNRRVHSADDGCSARIRRCGRCLHSASSRPQRPAATARRRRPPRAHVTRRRALTEEPLLAGTMAREALALRVRRSWARRQRGPHRGSCDAPGSPGGAGRGAGAGPCRPGPGPPRGGPLHRAGGREKSLVSGPGRSRLFPPRLVFVIGAAPVALLTGGSARCC